MRGGKTKVLAHAFASEAIGSRQGSRRAPSKHAEARCLHRLQLSGKLNLTRNKLTLVSIAFRKQDHGGNLQLCMARPCSDCTQRIASAGIKKIIYSTDSTLKKVKINQLLEEALPSSGFKIHNIGNPTIVPRLYMKTEDSFTQLKTGATKMSVLLNKGFMTHVVPGDIIEVMYNYDLIYMQVRRKKRYKTSKGMLEHEGIDKIFPKSKSITVVLRYIHTHWYSKHDERRMGVMALTLEHIHRNPS